MLSTAAAVATVIFSAVEAVLLRPLPFHDPARLVMLMDRNITQETPVGEISLGVLRDWRGQAAVPAIDVFTSVNWRYRVSSPGEPFTLTSREATLRLPPCIGSGACVSAQAARENRHETAATRRAVRHWSPV
jgi:hypothetical protein